jgi:hypothetical protein
MKTIPEHEKAFHELRLKYRLLARQGKVEEAIKMADEYFAKSKEVK